MASAVANVLQHTTAELVMFKPLKVRRKTRSLLSEDVGTTNVPSVRDDSPSDSLGVATSDSADPQDAPVVGHWIPTLDLRLVVDRLSIPVPPNVPVDLVPLLHDYDAEAGWYKPVLVNNDWWFLAADQHPINDTTPAVPLEISFAPESLTKARVLASFAKSLSPESSSLSMMGSDDETTDQVKVGMRFRLFFDLARVALTSHGSSAYVHRHSSGSACCIGHCVRLAHAVRCACVQERYGPCRGYVARCQVAELMYYTAGGQMSRFGARPRVSPACPCRPS